MKNISKRGIGIFVLLSLLQTACGRGVYETVEVPEDMSNGGLEVPGEGNLPGIPEIPEPETPPAVLPPEAPVPPTNPPPVNTKMQPLSWETSTKPERAKWSAYVYQVVDEEAFVDLDKAKDVERFCPKYYSLSEKQKINFWGALFSGISKFESNYNPLSRMHETTMGTDPVTKKPVYSEGLLQLSYQDVNWAPYCEFDWKKDQYLSSTDPKKTILDPYKNLRCGILIMANQVRRKGSIILSSGVYWAVLKTGGKYQKINQIIAITKKMTFCN